METIEERAYRKSLRCMRSGGLTTREACIEMAKEQRDIDIKNALNAVCKYCEHQCPEYDRTKCPQYNGIVQAMNES